MSLGVHGLALGLLLLLLRGQPAAVDTPSPPRVALTMVELVDLSDPVDVPVAPVRMRRSTQALGAAAVKTAAQRKSRRRQSAKRIAQNENNEARRQAASIPTPLAETPKVVVPNAAGVPGIPLRSGTARGTGSGDAGQSGGNRGTGSSTGGRSLDTGSAAGLGGREEDSYAAYGAALVRLVVAELDRSPVPGIGARDSVQLVLEVLPDGSLAMVGPRRFDIATVVRTSLGWLAIRQVLRRVATASRRFPDHPRGFSKHRFVVDVTVNFADRA